ncbi:hypothetical protein Naga_100355g1, partial [Nannochloropsis gaditana]
VFTRALPHVGRPPTHLPFPLTSLPPSFPPSLELAVQLLHLKPERRRRLERELRERWAAFTRGREEGREGGGERGGDGPGRQAMGEWLWAELFRDPAEGARRLR